MVKHKFMSIEDSGGLEVYLNNSKSLHNGNGYEDFKLRSKLHTPKKQIAEDFNVSYNTIKYSWLPKLLINEEKYASTETNQSTTTTQNTSQEN